MPTGDHEEDRSRATRRRQAAGSHRVRLAQVRWAPARQRLEHAGSSPAVCARVVGSAPNQARHPPSSMPCSGRPMPPGGHRGRTRHQRSIQRAPSFTCRTTAGADQRTRAAAAHPHRSGPNYTLAPAASDAATKDSPSRWCPPGGRTDVQAAGATTCTRPPGPCAREHFPPTVVYGPGPSPGLSPGLRRPGLPPPPAAARRPAAPSRPPTAGQPPTDPSPPGLSPRRPAKWSYRSPEPPCARLVRGQRSRQITPAIAVPRRHCQPAPAPERSKVQHQVIVAETLRNPDAPLDRGHGLPGVGLESGRQTPGPAEPMGIHMQQVGPPTGDGCHAGDDERRRRPSGPTRPASAAGGVVLPAPSGPDRITRSPARLAHKPRPAASVASASASQTEAVSSRPCRRDASGSRSTAAALESDRSR